MGKIDGSKIGVEIKLKDITIDMLRADAAARSVEALEWLHKQEKTTVERKVKNGSGSTMVKKPITQYRTEYLKKFCDYKPVSTINYAEQQKRKKERELKEIDDFYSAAIAKFNK